MATMFTSLGGGGGGVHNGHGGGRGGKGWGRGGGANGWSVGPREGSLSRCVMTERAKLTGVVAAVPRASVRLWGTTVLYDSLLLAARGVLATAAVLQDSTGV